MRTVKHSRIQLCCALLVVGLLVVLPIITPLAQAQDNCGFASVLVPFVCIDLSNFDTAGLIWLSTQVRW